MVSDRGPITIPERAFPAIGILASLSREQLSTLARMVTEFENSLDFRSIVKRVGDALPLGEEPMLMLAGLLMALNQMRVDRKLSPESLVVKINEAVVREADEEWKSEWLEKWKATLPSLSLLFQPNNLFSITGKTQELWLNRQTRVVDMKILTDLRPIYDEEATRTLALVLTNTLIVEVYDDASKEQRSIHLSLDQDDLATLRDELERTQKKNLAVSSDCERWVIDLLGMEGS